MSVKLCELCRLPSTEEHLESGYHKFNTNLFSQGKMPISEDSYNKFEKHRTENNTTDTSGSMANDDNHNHNVRSWHFTEIKFTEWSRIRLNQMIREKGTHTIPDQPHTLKIRFESIKGDAYLQNRKGKIKALFLFDCKIVGTVKVGNTVYTMKALIPEVTQDDPDDISIVDIKLDGKDKAIATTATFNNGTLVSPVLTALFRGPVKKALISIFVAYAKEFKAYTLHPRPVPPEITLESSDDDNDDNDDNKEDDDDKTKDGDAKTMSDDKLDEIVQTSTETVLQDAPVAADKTTANPVNDV